MNTSPSTNPITYPYDTELVRELLKQKRKVRGIRSCFPCRHRKVRCDGHEPCSTCIKRNHPELCRAPNSAPGTGSLEDRDAMQSHSASPSEVNLDGLHGPFEEVQTQAQAQAQAHTLGTDPSLLIARLEKIENQISALKADLRASAGSSLTATTPAASSPHPIVQNKSKSTGRHVYEDATGATIFLGSHSDTPLALGCRQPTMHELMLDQFVPRAYPFTDLWGPNADVKQICETLPPDEDVIRYWQTYQSTAYPFYPALVTMDQFGIDLFSFLDRRAAGRETITPANDTNPSWLALLFAVLASGVQFSDDEIKDRDLRSKVFICSSFQCLRLSNFFNRADLDQVQAMALIGHCLRNNLDTNSAWILMGATIRLAQSIGLHGASSSLPLSLEERAQRNRLWWMLIWQDCFLSFTYDRPTSAITMDCPIPYTGQRYTFQESVFTLCHILLERSHQESLVHLTRLQTTLHCKRQLEGVWNGAAPFLTDKSHCRSLQDHLERLALGVHLGYASCRLSRDMMEDEPDSTAAAADCLRHGMQAIESFLDLHRFSRRVCRSWAFVHNAVSCAITLKGQGLVEKSCPRGQMLVRQLIKVLEKEEKESEWCDADTNVRYFGPYSRALKALREIYHDL